MSSQRPRTFWWLIFSMEGRIPRSTYWLASIVTTVLGYSALFSMLAILGDSESVAFGIVALLIVVVLVPIFVGGKRWHDRDKSAWWLLIGCIPLVGWVWSFVECGCLRGTVGPNRFGPDPLAAFVTPPGAVPPQVWGGRSPPAVEPVCGRHTPSICRDGAGR